MPDEKGDQTKGSAEEAKAAMPAVGRTFLQRLFAEGWPLADTVGGAEVVEQEDAHRLPIGFTDLNGRKEIVLTASLDKWEQVFRDGLDYIAQLRKKA